MMYQLAEEKVFAILSLKAYLRYDIRTVNTSGLKDRTIKPLKVSLHQVPATGKLFMNNLIPANPSPSDYITEADMIEFFQSGREC